MDNGIGSGLEVSVRNSTYFQYGEPGVLGSVYRSLCPSCRCTYFPSFYEDENGNRFYYDPKELDA